MYLSAFPRIMKFFGTNASMVQTSLTSALLGLSLGQIVIGPLSDVHGRRKPLLISMILFSFPLSVVLFHPMWKFLLLYVSYKDFPLQLGLL
jgi:DHA1 family bicyclomycin/chloramphenicol resistance-like MFS transporter